MATATQETTEYTLDTVPDFHACTRREAARILGVSHTAMNNAVKDGRIKISAFGKIYGCEVRRVANLDFPERMTETTAEKKRRDKESLKKLAAVI